MKNPTAPIFLIIWTSASISYFIFVYNKIEKLEKNNQEPGEPHQYSWKIVAGYLLGFILIITPIVFAWWLARQ